MAPSMVASGDEDVKSPDEEKGRLRPKQWSHRATLLPRPDPVTPDNLPAGFRTISTPAFVVKPTMPKLRGRPEHHLARLGPVDVRDHVRTDSVHL
jgi:hypothetical protein